MLCGVIETAMDLQRPQVLVNLSAVEAADLLPAHMGLHMVPDVVLAPHHFAALDALKAGPALRGLHPTEQLVQVIQWLVA